jgi:A/G-specific adenine glycosylase
VSRNWFADRVLAWFDRHGRRHLPWQQDIDAYRVWVSEIMLQQTQVTTVIPYYERFMRRFPDVEALAAADLDEVLHHWTGLGYYARGRNLHAAARQVVAEHGGRFPEDPADLAGLPGIGRSTAGAITAIAFGRRAAILDGNVKRVLARFHAVPGYPGEGQALKTLWAHAEAHTPQRRIADYTQAMMDLGATVCVRRRPLCDACPVAARCEARRRGETERFPERKARRAKPERAARMFLVVDPGGRCLLEQRPAQGLWGGLWTPPERDADYSVGRLCDELGIGPADVADSRSGAVFRHTFTHFHLHIEPVYVDLARAPTTVADRADVCWYDAAAADAGPAIGLSAPAAKLLNTLKP